MQDVYVSVTGMAREESGAPMWFAIAALRTSQHSCLDRVAELALVLQDGTTLVVGIGDDWGSDWRITVTPALRLMVARRFDAESKERRERRAEAAE